MINKTSHKLKQTNSLSLAKSYKFSTLAVASILITGCATAPTIITLTPFNKSEAEMLLTPGPNAVRGSALIRQRGGSVVTCAGREVALIPATQHSTERMQALYGRTDQGYRPAWGAPKISFNNESSEQSKLLKMTRCDAQGFFRFDKVANGEFFVVTSIIWHINQYTPEGGALMNKIHLNNGETKELVLTP